MKIGKNRSPGFTLLEMAIVVAIIGLLVVLAMPDFVNARAITQQNVCISNLRQIDGAKQEWAIESDADDTVTPLGVNLQPYLGRSTNGSLPSCPMDFLGSYNSSYNTRTLAFPPACRISPTNHYLQ